MTVRSSVGMPRASLLVEEPDVARDAAVVLPDVLLVKQRPPLPRCNQPLSLLSTATTTTTTHIVSTGEARTKPGASNRTAQAVAWVTLLYLSGSWAGAAIKLPQPRLALDTHITTLPRHGS